jgi:hypothetical protein
MLESRVGLDVLIRKTDSSPFLRIVFQLRVDELLIDRIPGHQFLMVSEEPHLGANA